MFCTELGGKLIAQAIVLALLGVGIGCTTFYKEPTPTSLPNAPATALLLDADPLPRGWEADPCNPERCFRETYARRTFGRLAIPGSVIQQVYRLGSIEATHAKFQRVREVDFRPRQPPNLQFAPPAEITYRSPIADEYYFGCGVDRVPACKAIFRYGNYFVEFFFNVDKGYVDGVEIKGNGLKIEQIEPILRAMDERAAAVLGLQPKPTPTP